MSPTAPKASIQNKPFIAAVNRCATQKQRQGRGFSEYCLCDAPTAYQVDDQHYERNHQQQVNQAAGDMKAKAKQPQNQKHYENCPKHDRSPSLI
jgi:hypothetical protein